LDLVCWEATKAERKLIFVSGNKQGKNSVGSWVKYFSIKKSFQVYHVLFSHSYYIYVVE